ncbi:MAG: acyclic terpene utilization AtuA family protein [Acidimicrobiales bacterium]
MQPEPSTRRIRIGGGSGYWGDSDMAVPQLLSTRDLDYIAFDYLAEITMSILARARAKSPELGYATDFVQQVMAPNLAELSSQGVKILANAGGVNPTACTAEIEGLISDAGLDLTVATVIGDDLTDRGGAFVAAEEMFSGVAFPSADAVASINAYLGAFPIAEALQTGADIVVTGRCVDSALALAACIHEFGWGPGDWDLLAAGSLAGHLIECGPQATGGNHTDWETVASELDSIGYPIAEVTEAGTIEITKPNGTGGYVSRGTVAEQLLYEIGDPRRYVLPDVVCDFSEVVVEEVERDRVLVTGAVGRPAPSTYKVSATYTDGYRMISTWFFVGSDSEARARCFADGAIARTRRKLEAQGLGDFTEIEIDPFGAGSHFSHDAPERATREVALRIAARHEDPRALTALLKETTGMALATPPGMALYTGGRPSASPVVRLFSFLVEKEDVDVRIRIGDRESAHVPDRTVDRPIDSAAPTPEPPLDLGESMSVPLRDLVWGRSGDKGNNANIGLIARDPRYLPHVWDQVTEDLVATTFEHFLRGEVERFHLPGTNSMNVVLHDVLGGGGVASLRVDPQGKSYAEILLDARIDMPRELVAGGVS